MTKSNIFECRYIVYNTHEKKNKRKRGDSAVWPNGTRGLARSRKIRNTVSGWGFIAPLFLFFLVFTAIPVLVTLGYLCFTKYNIMTNPSWIGLDNFRRMLKDPSIPQVAWNVLRLPLYLVPAHVIFSLLMAYAVYRIPNKLFKGICRTVIYFPAITTTASVAIAWGYLFNEDSGLLRIWTLRTLGLISQDIPWTDFFALRHAGNCDFQYLEIYGPAFYSFIILLAWRTYQPDIMKLHEWMARMNGRIFTRVTIPLLTPSIFYVLLTTLIGTMQAFDEPFFVTGGGPGDNTRTVALFTYEKAFQIV